MTQFNSLHPKVQQFLSALQQKVPAGIPLTLDVNLSENYLHRFYIGVGGWQYELWHNCLHGEQLNSWGYSLVGYRPF